jgi:hypothetical protein
MSYHGHTCAKSGLPAMQRPVGPCEMCDYERAMDENSAFNAELDEFAAKVRASTVLNAEDFAVRINARDDDPPDTEVSTARPKYQPIPILTGCCIACGDRLDITQGPVNDVTCVRVRPHCACNQGVHLWQSLAARSGPRSPVLVELRQLERARDAAITHIANGDPKGALAALTMQRDTPELFDQATFDGDQR